MMPSSSGKRRGAYNRVIKGLERLQKESKEHERKVRAETDVLRAQIGQPFTKLEAERLHAEATQRLASEIEWINWLKHAREELLAHPPVTWDEKQAYDHLMKVIDEYLELYVLRSGSVSRVKGYMDSFLSGFTP